MAIDPKYLRASDGTGAAVLSHVTVARLVNATTIKVDNVDNWPPFFIATYGTLNANGYIVEASKKEFRGRIQSGDIIIEGFEPGFTDSGNALNDVVILKQTTSWADAMSENLVELKDEDIRRTDEMFGNGVVSGGVWTSTLLVANMTALVAYIDGLRVTSPAITSKTLTPTRDTYVRLSKGGAISYAEVAVNAAEPTLPADTITISKLTTNATAVTANTSLNRGVVKSHNIDFATFPKFSAYRNGNYDLPGGNPNPQKILLNEVEYDSHNAFSKTLNRFVAPVAGTYSFSGAMRINLAANDVYGVSLLKNGAAAKSGQMTVPTFTYPNSLVVSADIELAVGDYVELAGLNGSGTGKGISSGASVTYLSGRLLP